MVDPADAWVVQPSRQSDRDGHSMLAGSYDACEADSYHKPDTCFGGRELDWATFAHELGELIEESPRSGSLAL